MRSGSLTSLCQPTQWFQPDPMRTAGLQICRSPAAAEYMTSGLSAKATIMSLACSFLSKALLPRRCISAIMSWVLASVRVFARRSYNSPCSGCSYYHISRRVRRNDHAETIPGGMQMSLWSSLYLVMSSSDCTSLLLNSSRKAGRWILKNS